MKGIVLSKNMLAAYGVFVVLFAAQFAHAQAIELGQPAYGGTGCPAGLAPSITISNKGVVSVRYNNFTVQDDALKQIGRGNCSIRLPINVNGKYKLAVESVELRAIGRVPAQGRLDFHADANFVGGELVSVDQRVVGPKGTQNVRLAKRAAAVDYTDCGDSAMLALSANMIYTKPQGVSGTRGQARVLDAKLVLVACK